MFGNIKSIFSQPDNSRLQQSINEGAFLVDVRTPMEFAEGNVKGSVNIPLDQLAAQLSRFKDKNSIVVFCRSGSRSGMAKSILEQNGFTNVINGGAWDNVNSLVLHSAK
jgi:phage shock protein E